MKKINFKVLVSCFIIVYLVAFAGSLFTSQSTNSSWYASIKPSITPPNWVFPVVWNILFFLVALSLYFAWVSKFRNKKSEKSGKEKIILFFGINLFLNILWSFVFFYLKLPTLALVELVVFEISILVLILVVWRIRKLSSYFLIPYALWVAFAGILNGMIVLG